MSQSNASPLSKTVHHIVGEGVCPKVAYLWVYQIYEVRLMYYARAEIPIIYIVWQWLLENLLMRLYACGPLHLVCLLYYVLCIICAFGYCCGALSTPVSRNSMRLLKLLAHTTTHGQWGNENHYRTRQAIQKIY